MPKVTVHMGVLPKEAVHLDKIAIEKQHIIYMLNFVPPTGI